MGAIVEIVSGFSAFFAQQFEFLASLSFWPREFSGWELLNSAAVLGVAGVLIKVGQDQVAARKRQTAVESEQLDSKKEAVALEVAKKQATLNFAEASGVISDLKDGVEAGVANSNLLYQKTYEKTERYDYTVLIQKMAERNLREEMAKLLIEAFETYKPYKNGRVNVPDPILQRLREIEAELRRIGFFAPEQWAPGRRSRK